MLPVMFRRLGPGGDPFPAGALSWHILCPCPCFLGSHAAAGAGYKCVIIGTVSFLLLLFPPLRPYDWDEVTCGFSDTKCSANIAPEMTVCIRTSAVVVFVLFVFLCFFLFFLVVVLFVSCCLRSSSAPPLSVSLRSRLAAARLAGSDPVRRQKALLRLRADCHREIRRLDLVPRRDVVPQILK